MPVVYLDQVSTQFNCQPAQMLVFGYLLTAVETFTRGFTDGTCFLSVFVLCQLLFLPR